MKWKESKSRKEKHSQIDLSGEQWWVTRPMEHIGPRWRRQRHPRSVPKILGCLGIWHPLRDPSWIKLMGHSSELIHLFLHACYGLIDLINGWEVEVLACLSGRRDVRRGVDVSPPFLLLPLCLTPLSILLPSAICRDFPNQSLVRITLPLCCPLATLPMSSKIKSVVACKESCHTTESDLSSDPNWSGNTIYVLR